MCYKWLAPQIQPSVVYLSDRALSTAHTNSSNLVVASEGAWIDL
jgi:hypothetical protein